MARQDPTQDSCRNTAIRIIAIFGVFAGAIICLMVRLVVSAAS